MLHECNAFIFSDSEAALNPKSVIRLKRYLSRNSDLEYGFARDLFPAAGFLKPATGFCSSAAQQPLRSRNSLADLSVEAALTRAISTLCNPLQWLRTSEYFIAERGRIMRFSRSAVARSGGIARRITRSASACDPILSGRISCFRPDWKESEGEATWAGPGQRVYTILLPFGSGAALYLRASDGGQLGGRFRIECCMDAD